MLLAKKVNSGAGLMSFSPCWLDADAAAISAAQRVAAMLFSAMRYAMFMLRYVYVLF